MWYTVNVLFICFRDLLRVFYVVVVDFGIFITEKCGAKNPNPVRGEGMIQFSMEKKKKRITKI